MSSKNILKNIFEKELGMDVVLKVPDDEREIKAHRLILAGASSYFEKLFLGPWSEEEKKADPVVVVDMNEITFEVLEMLVSFIYTEEMEFTKKCSVRSAIIAADYFMMDCAIEKLSEYVTQNIQEETVCEIYQVSDKLSPKVKQDLTSYLRKGLKIDKIKEGLLKLTFDKFKTLVQKDVKNPIDENDAVLAIEASVRHDWKNRQGHVLDLLKSVEYSFERSRRSSKELRELVNSMWRICTSAETKGFIVAYLMRREGKSRGWMLNYFKD